MTMTDSGDARLPMQGRSQTVELDGHTIEVSLVSVCACDHDSCWVQRGSPWHEDCACPREGGWMEARIFDGTHILDWETSTQILLPVTELVDAMERVAAACRGLADNTTAGGGER